MTKAEIVKLCDQFQPGNRKTFQTIIAEFVKLDPRNEERLARALGISKPTIRRYIHGENIPYQLLQKPAVGVIRRLLG